MRNINAQIPHGYTEQDLATFIAKYSRSWGMHQKWLRFSDIVKRDVYLVDPDLMDMLVPPSQQKTIDEECAKRRIAQERERRKIRERERPSDAGMPDMDDLLFDELDIWDIIGECEVDWAFIRYVALGAYFSPSHQQFRIGFYSHNLEQIHTPAIFICPERCDASAQRLAQVAPTYNNPELFRTLFSAVALHEMAHMYMDPELRPTKPRFQPKHADKYPGFIEESLANLVSILALNNSADYNIISKFTERQPLEYKAWRFWEQHFNPTKTNLRQVASGWGARDFWPVLRLSPFQIKLSSRLRRAFYNAPDLQNSAWRDLSSQILDRVLNGP